MRQLTAAVLVVVASVLLEAASALPEPRLIVTIAGTGAAEPTADDGGDEEVDEGVPDARAAVVEPVLPEQQSRAVDHWAREEDNGQEPEAGRAGHGRSLLGAWVVVQ